MFTTLLESRAVRQRRTASSLASIVFHSVIITGAVIATARGTIQTAEPPVPVEVIWIPTQPPRPAPTTRPVHTATAGTFSSPIVERILIAPTTIPTTIPAIDFSAEPTTGQPIGPVGRTGVVCDKADCAGPVMDGDRVLLTSADISIQIREQPAPRYPEGLRRAGIEGDVKVKFLVDTTGRIDMRSVEILASTHDGFTAAVREALTRMRFEPSRIGERKVQALAIMPFRFTLR